MANRNNRMMLPIVLVAVAFLGCVGWYIWSRSSKPTQPTVNAADMKLAIAAVAASENGKYDQAIGLWRELIAKFPDNPDLKLNQAVTAVKWIDDTRKKLDSGNITDAALKSKLLEDLAAAIQKADVTISEFANREDDSRSAFLQATYLEAKSRQLSDTDGIEMRFQAAQVLVKALEKNPSQSILAYKLDELVQELGEDGSDFAKPLVETLYASWKADPRNLYLFVNTMRTFLKGKDARLTELLEKLIELAKPVRSRLESDLKDIQLEELVKSSIEAIQNGNWRETQKLHLFLNVLVNSPPYTPDVRLVKPDVMALIDTTFLDRFAASMVSGSAKKVSMSLPKFETKQITDRDADLVGWYDYDLDLDQDVVVVHGNRLTLFATSDVGIGAQLQQELDLPIKPIGMIPVDLFEVDSTLRPRVPASVSELMNPSSGSKNHLPKEGATTVNAIQVSKAKRHDTFQELVLWGKDGIAVVTPGKGTGSEPSNTLSVIANVPGLSGAESTVLIEPCDIDGDGDLDLVAASKDRIRLLQNNGNRTFVDVSSFSDLPDTAFEPINMVALDIDRDLDQDLLVVGKGQSGVFLLENMLHSQFRFRKLEGELWKGLEAGTRGGSIFAIQAAELDGNSSWDICGIGPKGIFTELTRTVGPGRWTESRWAIANDSIKSARSMAVVDINNDACLDFLIGNEDGLKVCIGHDQHIGSLTSQTIANGSIDKLAAIDADQNGTLDLLCLVDGKPTLLSPSTEAVGGYVSARIHGVNDVNGGGRINHYAVGSTLELRCADTMQARTIRDPATHFGIGTLGPDNLRIIFNNGLTQNTTNITPNTLIEEMQELKGSCPFVYGWNGDRFELITDLLWNAPLGLQIAPGKVLPDRRWEYLLLPGELVQSKDGYFELQVTEELWEVAYFDHIRLTAIDHPEDVDVFTNEKVGPPSIAQPKMMTARNKLFPIKATDSHGRDCLSKIRNIDRNFVQAFDVQICQGLCEPHFIELDFGRLASDKSWQLFLNGWMHPTDTSLNIGISQNPERSLPEPPSLWVVDSQGEWTCAQPFMGFPGGKPKSIVIDLDGVFQGDDHRIRIGSSQQLYWDQAFVANDSDASQCILHELPIASADLHYRGFGRLLERAPDQPHWYDYHSVSSAPKWPALEGPFTRYGDVQSLIGFDDDQMVVMVSGDEITVRFNLPSEPVRKGWRRDFVMHNVGWDKDADLNTLMGDGSLPLPFSKMNSYPPPANQMEEASRVYELNRSHLKRSGAGSQMNSPH